MLGRVERPLSAKPESARDSTVRADELVGMALFEGLRPDQLEALAPLLRRACFAEGQQVFVAGEPAAEMYLVESGEVRLWIKPDDGDAMELARIRPGGVVGRSAALGRSHYTASAECLVDTQLLAVRGSELRRVMRADPALGHLLIERIARIAANRSTGWRDQLVKLFQF